MNNSVPRRFPALLCALFLCTANLAAAATITVNSTADTATAGDAQCTLREAITNANSNSDTTSGDCAAGSGTDTIQFNIGSGTPTIALASQLPNVTSPMVIDGSAGPGGSTRVEINGANAGSGVTGLVLDGSIGSTIRRLVINRFSGNGVFLSGSDNNVFEGNFIGTDATGTVRQANSLKGIFLSASQDNQIGGTTGTTPGGSCTGACNLISGNSEGVNIESFSSNQSIRNIIEGNFIGPDVTGTAAIGNTSGIRTFNIASQTRVSSNVISGNGTGLNILGGANNSVIEANLIGTDSSGTAVLANSYGIRFLNVAQSLTIRGNVISGNARSGIYGSLTNSTITGNFVGTDVTGTLNLGNGYYSGQGSALEGLGGISLNNSADNNVIGGITIGAPNVVAFNRGAGVRLGKDNFTNASGPSNPIRGNSIYLNDGLGISLRDGGGIAGTPLPNDTLDPDTGANSRQNRPVLNSVSESSGVITVSGTLNSLPTTSFLIDFYASENADVSGFGEGQTYVGTRTVTTDANGDAAISFNYPAVLGQPFTAATATNPARSSSARRLTPWSRVPASRPSPSIAPTARPAPLASITRPVTGPPTVPITHRPAASFVLPMAKRRRLSQSQSPPTPSRNSTRRSI
jgi:CSLREA domain-containing protein